MSYQVLLHLQTLDYYESIAEFDDNQPVFVFSDSVDWVRQGSSLEIDFNF